MTLGKKIVSGFGSLVVIAAILGASGYYNAGRSAESIHDLGQVCLPSVRLLQEIKLGGEQIKTAQRTLLAGGLTPEMLKRQADLVATAMQDYQTAWKAYEKFPRSPAEERLWTELVTTWQQWGNDNTEFFRLSDEMHNLKVGDPDKLRANLERFRGDHYKLEASVLTAIGNKQIFEGGDDHTQCAFGKWKAAYKAENPQIQAALAECEQFHRQFHESVKKIKGLIQAGDAVQAAKVQASEMAPCVTGTLAQFDRMLKVAADSQALDAQMEHQATQVCRAAQLKANELLDKLIDINAKEADDSATKATGQAGFAKATAVVATGAGLALAALLALLITRSITRSINRIVAALSSGAEQTASASTQVSGASQSLAQGASEQAASLEETSSSLEEMSSMTKKNAETAQQAASLSAEAKKAADSGNAAMQKMSTAINDIQKSAGETAKIIKVIDEIAFQTNLLALNAAVEAARAGEAGKGFAVVAEEVRNLAMRSAEAAKNTAAMIEESVNNAKNGVSISAEVAKTLGEITDSNTKVNGLVGEIAAASQEQSQGIDQVNTAVSQMDKVTQSNAANAEESASAAEELSAQAEQMRHLVDELIALVGGAGQATTTRQNASAPSSRKRVSAAGASPRQAAPLSQARELIPLDGGDARPKNFAEFSKAA